MSTRREINGTLAVGSKSEKNSVVLTFSKGATKAGAAPKKTAQKMVAALPVAGTPSDPSEMATPPQGVVGMTVPGGGVTAARTPPALPKLIVEVGPADVTAAAARQTDIGVSTALEAVGGFARLANLKEDIGRPSLPASGRFSLESLSGGTPRLALGSAPSARASDAHPMGRVASAIGNLAIEAKGELEGLKNNSREVKESVFGKLPVISELALRLEESLSSYIAELERENAIRAYDMEAAEKRLSKITAENLDRILQVEKKIDKMAAEISSTRPILGHFDVPEKLEAIRKAAEAKPCPSALNCAEAAAKPKPMTAAALKTPGSEIRSGKGHTLIVSSKYENYTAEQVVAKLHDVVDAREMSVAVDRLRKARNQKVVLSCTSAEDAKKIEERLKMRGADLKVAKPEKRLPTVVTRDVLKINSDEDNPTTSHGPSDI